MIGKLLLTLLVIALVVLYLRKRHHIQRDRSAQRDNGAQGNTSVPVRGSDRGELEQFLSRARGNAQPGTSGQYSHTAAPGSRLKVVLWTVLAVLLIGGSLVSYLHWQDQQRLVTVLLHRDASGPPVIYRVAKRDLGSNSFITNDGKQVTVSANERMEVVGL